MNGRTLSGRRKAPKSATSATSTPPSARSRFRQRRQVVEVQNVKQLGNVVYDNQSKQKPSSVSGSVVHIKRNPRDGSYYMRADGSGEVKYVYRK